MARAKARAKVWAWARGRARGRARASWVRAVTLILTARGVSWKMAIGARG